MIHLSNDKTSLNHSPIKSFSHLSVKIIIDQFNQCTIAKKEATKLSGYEARQVHEWFMKRKKQVHADPAEKNYAEAAK